VAVSVHGIVIVVDEVPSSYVINVPVTVIIYSVTNNFAGVRPDTTIKIEMVVVNTSVDNRHDNALAGVPGRPDLGGVNAIDTPVIATTEIGLNREWIDSKSGTDSCTRINETVPKNVIKTRGAGGR
jgi:hypothetical protein